MGKKLLGLCAAMAMLAAGGAYAQQEQQPPPQAGQMEEMKHELTGTVVQADQKTVYVEYMGAIVPLKIESSTKFMDPQLQRARDLKPGQEIRASFKVEKKTDNVAETISLEKGMGGTGEPSEPTQPSE